MPYTNIESPPAQYYPEVDYDYSFYYENELKNMSSPVSKSTSLDLTKGTAGLPTIHYLNERKCPIYVHQINKDSSLYSNYNEKLTTPRKMAAQLTNQNVNKMVLDKLEETYWATWKPKKEHIASNKFNMPGKVVRAAKPMFYEHKGMKSSHKSHGDTHENIIKFFKAKRFDTSSSDTVGQEGSVLMKNNSLPRTEHAPKKLVRPGYHQRTTTTTTKIGKQETSVSQEIQTEVHCPVILEEPPHCDDVKDEFEQEQPVKEQPVVQPPKVKGKGKSKKGSSKTKQLPVQESKSKSIEVSESVKTFVDHKDSIEITKKKQEKAGQKEHYKQPKSIKLYRKSGHTTSYIKGGTYPLKSCLRKDQGSFKLGPPGSPLFITSSSFSNRKRK